MAVDKGLTFAILGPLTVQEGDRHVDVGGARQAALLTLLLLQGGQPISADRLADDLWAGEPPPGAAKTIQVYISRLRAALGDGFVARLGTGYALKVEPDHVDAQRFEQLVDDGRRHLLAGNARAARERLDQALS